jgi:hypothetical protein
MPSAQVFVYMPDGVFRPCGRDWETAKKPGQTLGRHETAGTNAGTPPLRPIKSRVARGNLTPTPSRVGSRSGAVFRRADLSVSLHFF